MDLNRAVSYSLRAGVVVGASLSTLGLVLWGLQGFADTGPAVGRGLLDTILSTAGGNVTGIVYLGVIVLIATPIFRVLLSAIFFGAQRDTKYVGITSLVLGMIILGFVIQAAT